MFKQKGYIPLAFLLILTLLGVGFYAGLKAKTNYIAQEKTASLSAEVKDLKLATAVSAEVSKANPASPTPQADFSRDGYAGKQDASRVEISGRFTIPDHNKIWYSFSFPKAGGELTGHLNGFCNGEIKGRVDSPDSDNEAKFNGELKAECQPYIGNMFNKKMESRLEGLISYRNGLIKVIYNFSNPYPLRGSIDLHF